VLDAMVSLKASLDAWDKIDSLLRRSLAAYAETLRHFEEHVCRPAAEKFKIPGVDFAPQRDALTRPGLSPADSLPVLESVGRAIEQQLRSYGQRLRQNGCSASDLRDVLDALNASIQMILNTGTQQEAAMRGVAGRLKIACESDNVALLRILVRHQSIELSRLADETQRHSLTVADQFRQQVVALSAGLNSARDEARRDVLTGMINRRALEELFHEFEGRPTLRCLILLDIDRFKSVNDRYGYLAGDELLRQIAARIQAALDPAAVAARWGGDEFIVLLEGDLPAGMSLARHLNQQLCASYDLSAGKTSQIHVQASVGLSEWKLGESAASVLQRADLALKARKHSTQRKLPNAVA
jgi:diguanylate cyclase (GGDEF)-like protein